ncbi:MAG: DUF4836 family protein, partial [Ignavibacteriales bacterium]|nr:DUF4836 family protein [Ignavibacteriales bacterium]
MMRRRWLQMAAITGGILLVLAILYRHTIADLYTFWTDGTPQYSRAIPARAIVVLRCNVAKLALKGDLGTLSGHRQIAVLKEKIGRLYPRMDALFANPFEETGIQLANNQYLFVVPEPAGGAGILFGVRDRDKAAKFLTHLSEGMLPEKEGAYDLLRLSSGAAIGWNDAFGILFVRTNGERELTVAEWDALMNPTDSGSFMKDVEKS